jgi:excisionase family DNA binding protein
MTVTEAARALGIAPSTLRHQIKNRKVKAHKMGTDWYIAPAEVARYRDVSLGRYNRRENDDE